jgi:hypothetical protein
MYVPPALAVSYAVFLIYEVGTIVTANSDYFFKQG